MTFRFGGAVWYWRGPAPWFFVTVPPEIAEDLKAMSSYVTYGWGMIPARIRIGATEWKTALWPHESSYIVPIKVSVRRAEGVEEGDVVNLELEVG